MAAIAHGKPTEPQTTLTAAPTRAPEPAGGAAPTSPAAAPVPTPGASGAVGWSELRYSARKLFLTATATLSVDRVPADALRGLVRRPPKGAPVPLPGGDAVAVSMATDLPFGRSERVVLWLDPANGAALGGEKTTLGSNPYRKAFRFTQGGLYTWRSSPKDSREAGLDPEAWTRSKQYLVSPADAPEPGTPVTDSYGLLYLVSAARLDRKDGSMSLVLLTDDGYVELVFVSGGLTYRRASFDESWPGGGVRRDGQVLVRTVRATSHAFHAADAGPNVDLGFLGMRGTLDLDVEVGTGIPIAFSGRAEHLGQLNVRLDRVVLTAPPPEGNPIP